MTETERTHYFIKGWDGKIRDSGFDFVQYDQTGGWEPSDYPFVRGFDGTGKKWTDIEVFDESALGETPLKSNIGVPRTGTAAA